MKQKALWAATALLGALCAAQAYYIFTGDLCAQETPVSTAPAQGQEEPGMYDPWEEMEKWRQGVHQRMRAGGRPGHGDFDGFFNDEFFSRRFSAFEQMERMHRQMLQAFEGAERGSFGKAWDGWFEDRLGMKDFPAEVERSKGVVTMTIRIPGLQEKNAEISVNKDRVRLAFTTKAVNMTEKEGARSRSESVRSFVKVLPVPEGADGEKAAVKVDSDTVRIEFPAGAAR